jgi:hypothetical protein
MNNVKLLLVITLTILAFNGTGCNDFDSKVGSQNSLTDTDVASGNNGEVHIGIDSSNSNRMDDIDMDDREYHLINIGMANSGAKVIYGEDGELCIVDEPSGTCYKLTLADTRWKLVEVSVTKNRESEEVIDYSVKNIIYEFKGNDKLIVSGKIDDPFVSEDFQEGEHFYYYRMMIGCPVCLPAPNLIIKNLPSKYYFAYFDDTKMNIVGESFVGWVDRGDGLIIGGDRYWLEYNFKRLGDQVGETDGSSNTSVRDNPRILKKSISTRR